MSGLADLVTPTMARMIEMLTSGALPLLVFILLPAYSSWSSQPDSDDMRSGYRSVSTPHTSHLTPHNDHYVVDGADEISQPTPLRAEGTASPASVLTSRLDTRCDGDLFCIKIFKWKTFVYIYQYIFNPNDVD